jgi:hypothetical protein
MYTFRLTRIAGLAGLVAIGLSAAVSADEAALDAKAKAGKEYKPGDTIPFVLKYNIDKNGDLLPDGKFVEEKGWTPSDFYGRAAVRVEGDTAILEEGHDMTGIRWTGPLRKMNYEITLEAQRMAGSDFFCGLTFPYNDDPCSLIVGGWGGRLVGISSFNEMDASENGSATWRDFDKGRWYSIRLRVTPSRIEAWIDESKLIDETTEGRKIGIRWEVEKSRPLGIASWETTGAIRNAQLRGFAPDVPKAKSP